LITSQGSDIQELQAENIVLKDRNHINEGRITRIEKEVADLREELLRTQQHSMKENIIFQNIPETPNENVYQLLNDLLVNRLRINNDDMMTITVLRAHRFGAKQGHFHRQIVAKINDEGRSVIFRHTRNLKGSNISVFTQLPRPLAERRKQLVPAFKEARASKVPTKWFGDKLQVGSKMMVVTPDKSADINIDAVHESRRIKVVRAPSVSEGGSGFQGCRVKVVNPDDVIPALYAIYRDLHVARATHNTYAYRIQSHDKMIEHYEDDNEHGAGSRIMEYLRANNVTNTLVCVSRWHGGSNLGPARFQVMIENVKSALAC